MFTELEKKYRENDPVKVVRRWDVSPVVYGLDSRERMGANPHYHPTICQTEDGKYCDPVGRPIPKSQIPSYILNDGPPPDATSMSRTLGRTISMADAMRDTGMIGEHGEIRPQPILKEVETPKRKRGRPRKVKE